MSVYSLLKNNPKPSSQEIENSLDGNICRCTGYRAILDAMKSFSVDEAPIDIEDLEKIKCLNGHNCRSNGVVDCNHNHVVSDKNSDSFYAINGNEEWYTVESLNELTSLMATLPSSKTRNFLSGNTSVGVFKNDGPYQAYINIKNVSELNVIERKDDCLVIGASVTLNTLQSTFKTYALEATNVFGHLNDLAKSLEKVASNHIRNVATWSGYLVMKKKHPSFPSDVLVVLEAANAKLNIINVKDAKNSARSVQVSLTDFLRDQTLENGFYLIESLLVPGIDTTKHQIKAFKVSLRAQNSHSYVNAGNFVFINKIFPDSAGLNP
jgi:xanthine dehydrogenase/oxidase